MHAFLTALFIASALVAVSWVAGMIENRGRKKRGYWVTIDGGTRRVAYREDANSIAMDFEIGGIGIPSTLYAPTVEEWDENMPDWAKGRRSEIMERVIGELGTKGWVYDGYPP